MKLLKIAFLEAELWINFGEGFFSNDLELLLYSHYVSFKKLWLTVSTDMLSNADLLVYETTMIRNTLLDCMNHRTLTLMKPFARL